MDGFLIGALGAICFTAVGTLTRLAPQFATGLIANRPISVLLIQAGLQGVALPLIATSFGGLVGATLWFGRPKLIVTSVLTTLVVYGGLGLMELVPALESLQFVVYLVVTVFALLALRIGLQIALLHEGHVPTSRTPPDAAPELHTTHGWLFKTLGAGVNRRGGNGCDSCDGGNAGSAPLHVPARLRASSDRRAVEINPRFISADGRFSVQYPGPGSLYKAKL